MQEVKNKVQYYAIEELHLLEDNPRTITKKQLETLKTSIKNNPDFFEARPLILSNRTGKNVILAGNQRFRAAQALGMKQVPCVLLEGLDSDREKEIVIRDNVSNGEWDFDILANSWDEEKLAEWGVNCTWAQSDGIDRKDIQPDIFALKIEIECESEQHQQELFEEFTGRGLKCKAI